jgi:uncharacterized protein (TIGR03435 family)
VETHPGGSRRTGQDSRLNLRNESERSKIWAPAPATPNIFQAFQEQLGLKLESTRAPADVIVIDKAEKPSDN